MVRALGYGGLDFEDDNLGRLAEAMAALEQGLVKWFKDERLEDETIEMKPGDFINIPAFKKHRVDWTTPDEPTVWLGVRYGEAT